MPRSTSTPLTRAQVRDAVARDITSSDVPRIRLRWGRITILLTMIFCLTQGLWIIGKVIDLLPVP